MNRSSKTIRGRSATASWLVAPGLLILLAAIDAWLFRFSKQFSSWPFLISFFVLGMPHGAADLDLFARAIGARSLLRALPRFLPYLLILALATLAIVVAPSAALLAFAFLSAWHFGREDRHGTRQRKFRGLVRGLFIISAPIALHPADVVELVDNWLGLLGREPLNLAVWSRIVQGAGWVAGGAVVLACAGVFLLLWQGQNRTLRRELVELAALGVAFVVLDPVFGVGAYFLCWHSLRQIDLRNAGGGWAQVKRIIGLNAGSLPLLVPTIAVYALISWWRIGSWNPALQVALLIIFFAAVTPAHELLALWLERPRRRTSASIPTRLPAVSENRDGSCGLFRASQGSAPEGAQPWAE